MYYSICPNCGHSLDPYSDICPYCGYKAPDAPDTNVGHKTMKGGDTLNSIETIFRKRLKDARKEKGLTIADLAEAAETSVSSMWGYENGRTYPSIDTAARMAKALGVTIDYLAGLDK